MSNTRNAKPEPKQRSPLALVWDGMNQLAERLVKAENRIAELERGREVDARLAKLEAKVTGKGSE